MSCSFSFSKSSFIFRISSFSFSICSLSDCSCRNIPEGCGFFIVAGFAPGSVFILTSEVVFLELSTFAMSGLEALLAMRGALFAMRGFVVPAGVGERGPDDDVGVFVGGDFMFVASFVPDLEREVGFFALEVAAGLTGGFVACGFAVDGFVVIVEFLVLGFPIGGPSIPLLLSMPVLESKFTTGDATPGGVTAAGLGPDGSGIREEGVGEEGEGEFI